MTGYLGPRAGKSLESSRKLLEAFSAPDQQKLSTARIYTLKICIHTRTRTICICIYILYVCRYTTSIYTCLSLHVGVYTVCTPP